MRPRFWQSMGDARSRAREPRDWSRWRYIPRIPEPDGVASARMLGSLRVRMLSDYTNNPKHWQARAAEMRAIACNMAEDGIKASILRMATDYDKLAARAIARTSGEAA
jgi:hypothetical protein